MSLVLALFGLLTAPQKRFSCTKNFKEVFHGFISLQGALVVELKHAGITFQLQQVFPLIYRSEYVGAYIADIVVNNKIILELKSVSQLTSGMEAQLINYLKLSGIPVGYLFNFYPVRLQWHRFVNTRKGKL
jgi:GxxExxY protein